MSVFGVILVRLFALFSSIFSPNTGKCVKNADQNNSEYGHFLRSVINFLNNTPKQPIKFRTKNWIEINDEDHGTYNTNSQIEFKTTMLRSNLCDYSDAYIL